MSIFYILLLFACLGVVASQVAKHSELSVHKGIGWKNAGSKSDLAIEETEHIAKFQSFAAPDEEVAQNQTVEEAMHIAEYYIDVFNKLVKVNNFTELGLYFKNEVNVDISFYVTCVRRNGVPIRLSKDDFLKRVYNEQANWKLNDVSFSNPNKIFVTLDMNMFGYVEDTHLSLKQQPDGSWQWSFGVCRFRKCVDPDNT